MAVFDSNGIRENFPASLYSSLNHIHKIWERFFRMIEYYFIGFPIL